MLYEVITCTPPGYVIPDDDNGDPKFLYIDLLKYQGGEVRALLTGEVIPAGTYQQLRLQVLDGQFGDFDVNDDGSPPFSYEDHCPTSSALGHPSPGWPTLLRPPIRNNFV